MYGSPSPCLPILPLRLPLLLLLVTLLLLLLSLLDRCYFERPVATVIAIATIIVISIRVAIIILIWGRRSSTGPRPQRCDPASSHRDADSP